ncbi:serine/threonine-protein kinase [Thermomonas sp. HDW16]|uniref:serine/threonine-protein kinase n=1 Tax=Thermomonas sp. HDW16 TaxID=2714945 RepID=UPI0014092BE2|nr:serine/threonine-protein kinase [Thermomonas sp. HDW16]QIL19527.1 serine/threonine protein kinase [Thermomonas sp. HDW16]
MDAERWQRLSPLLDALLELPEQQRNEHLAALRREDAALADELEKLLALEEGDDDFLAEPVVEVPNGARPGARIGPYRLDRLIGEGGMGQVWLAARADGLYERKVALKLLRAGLADPKLRQRFDREREILARFAHPYIARLLDAGIDRDGQPYLALEYVDGEPITSYCQSRQLDIAARLDLFRQICEAVSHAHANLIVHRDLKPSNILVTPAGHVRLLDFGIAKLLDVELLPVEATRTGVRTFTLHYAAPEQIRGEPVTTMTDVYSLGVVLYELLTGSKPYRLKRQTDAEWEEAILAGEPLRPSQAAVRAEDEATRPYSPARLARELAGDLDNITLKALGKRPEQRYVSAEALSQDLLSYLRGRPVLARGESLGYRTRKYLHRHRWALGAAGLVLAVMVTALAVVGWQARQALREANRAQAMQNFIAGLFESAGNTPLDAPMDLRTLLDLGIVRGERSLARQPQARAELYGVVARLRLGLGDYREASALLDKQASLLRALPSAPTSLKLEAATLRGNVRRQFSDVRGCEEQMQPLLALAEREQEQLPGQVAAFYSQLARCRRDLDERNLANQLFSRSLKLRREHGDDVGVAESLLDLSSLYADDGNPRQAIRVLREALAQFRHKIGDRHPLAIDMLRSLCSLERNNDDLAAAERDCRASLALAQDLHGRDHRATIDARRQLAALYVDLGRYGEAESEFLDAYAWMRTRMDRNHPDLARTYNSLGIVAWERGNLQRAIEYQTMAVDAWRSSGNAALIAAGTYNLAMILHSAQQDTQALSLIRESRDLRVRRFGANHALVGDNDRLLGEILASLGKTDAANAALQEAVTLTRTGYGEAHSHTRRAEIALARLQAGQGDAAAVQRLRGWARHDSGDIEQRKAGWLARAYAAEIDCASRPAQARGELDAVLAQIQLALPEGGALPREIAEIRANCGKR